MDSRSLCILPFSGPFTSRCHGYRLKPWGFTFNQPGDVHELSQIESSCRIGGVLFSFAFAVSAIDKSGVGKIEYESKGAGCHDDIGKGGPFVDYLNRLQAK